MKKMKTFLVILVIAFSFVYVAANWVLLWRHSYATYVEYYHEDGFNDEYIGVASVKGIDRFMIGNDWYYYYSTQITFDVQGEISRGVAYANGYNNTTINRIEVIAKDKWNIGDKTTAKYAFTKRLVPGGGYLPNTTGELD